MISRVFLVNKACSVTVVSDGRKSHTRLEFLEAEFTLEGNLLACGVILDPKLFWCACVCTCCSVCRGYSRLLTHFCLTQVGVFVKPSSREQVLLKKLLTLEKKLTEILSA